MHNGNVIAHLVAGRVDVDRVGVFGFGCGYVFVVVESQDAPPCEEQRERVTQRLLTGLVGEGDYKVPNLTESASVDAEGRLQITIGNLSLTEDCPVETSIVGFAGKKACACILRGAMDAKNTFEEPDAVQSEEYKVELTDGGLSFTVPACSIVKITVEE